MCAFMSDDSHVFAGMMMTNSPADSAEILSDAEIENAAHEHIVAERYEEAFVILKQLCERDSGYAFRALGSFYETGLFVPVDKQMARSYYLKAIEQEYRDAYLYLGWLLIDLGDEEGARRTFESGAKLDFLPCMYRVGHMMLDGEGGAADPAQGQAWLQKAADGGHLFAQRWLLGLEMRESRSIFAKIRVAYKIGKLVKIVLQEHLRDPHSDLLT